MALSRIVEYDGEKVTFKYFRYYGIYSRRGKKLADQLMEANMGKQTRKVENQKRKQREGWRNKLKTFTGKDPLECWRCKEIMEYKGKVSLKSGILEVAHAVDDFARKRLKELAGIDVPSKQKEKETKKEKPTQGGWENSQIRLFAV
jgi:hypothetical protein